MNVFDFDKTIYWDDCARDFYFYALKKKPTLMFQMPQLGLAYAKFKLKKITRTQFKEVLYRYVTKLDNLDEMVTQFWQEHEHKLKGWYLEMKQRDDLIISASPAFLIKPICEQLQVNWIASDLDVTTGKYQTQNAYGDYKVVLFNRDYPGAQIDEFYSDSLSDTPLAKLAKRAFLVTGNQRDPWPNDVLMSDKSWD